MTTDQEATPARVDVRTPYSIPDDEFADMDEEDIRAAQDAEDGLIDVPDDELTPEQLAQVQRQTESEGDITDIDDPALYDDPVFFTDKYNFDQAFLDEISAEIDEAIAAEESASSGS